MEDNRKTVLRLLIFGLFIVYATAVMMQRGSSVPQPPESTAAETAAETTAETAPPTPQPQYQPTRDIYLTFDDGPCKNTPRVLDILDQYGAKATFFTVGFFVDRYPEYAAEIVRRGNLIACHSYTHELDECYASADAFMAEVAHWRTAAENACGALPARICVRFPGGSTTPHADAVREDIFARLAAEHYRWFDWNAADNDKWQKGNTESLPDEQYFMQSYQTTIGQYRDLPETPVVFLMHDTENGTVNILPDILADLRERGYGFKTLDQHPDWERT